MTISNITEDGARITDPYGWADWRGYKHTGLDLAGRSPGRTPRVYSPVDGRIIFSGNNVLPYRNGNYKGVLAEDGITVVVFGHMVNIGDTDKKVKKGDGVGNMSDHGLSKTAGIHLHLEVWRIPDAYRTSFLKDPSGWAFRNPVAFKRFDIDPYPWLLKQGMRFTKGSDGVRRLQPVPKIVVTKPAPEVVKPIPKEWSEMASKQEIIDAGYEGAVKARNEKVVPWTDSQTGKVTMITEAKALGNLSVLKFRENQEKQ